MKASTAWEQAKEFLLGRAQSYRRLFAADNRDAQAILEDLAKFCRANESTFHANERIASRLDGRREVFLRIRDHLKLTDDELIAKYVKTPPPTEKET